MFVLIVLSISKLSGYFGFLRTTRPAFVLFGFCLAYAVANPAIVRGTRVFRIWPARVIAGIGIAACCSAAFGISFGRAAMFIITDFWKNIALALLLVTGVRQAVDLRRMVTAVSLGAIVLAWLSLFLVGISKTSSGVTYDANDVGLIMVMSLPIVLLTVQTSHGLMRVIALIGLVLLGATIAKSQSRGAFIGTLSVGAGLLLLLPGIHVARRIAYVAAAAATMSMAAPTGYWDAMQSIIDNPKADYNWDALNGRRNIAKRGVQYMLAYPVFGVGINNFPMAEGTISDKAIEAGPHKGVRWAAPHNTYIQAGAETGVVGLALYLWLLIGGPVACWRLRSRMPAWWRSRGSADQQFLYQATVYLPIAFIGYAVSSAFVSFAWIEPVYVLSALVTGMYIALEVEARRSTAPADPQRSRLARVPSNGRRRVPVARAASQSFAP